MSEVQAFFGEIRRAVKGCPEPTMQDAVVRAARAFCGETWVLRRAASFVCVAGTAAYTVQAPANEEVVAVKRAQVAEVAPGSGVHPLRFVYPATVNPNAGMRRPYGICFVPYTQVALSPPPDAAYPVTVELVTQPVAGAAVIADELAVQYDRALGYGALEWLLRMAGEPWFSPPQAERYLQLFNQEIVKARGAAMFDFTPNQRSCLRAGFVGGRAG